MWLPTPTPEGINELERIVAFKTGKAFDTLTVQEGARQLLTIFLYQQLYASRHLR